MPKDLVVDTNVFVHAGNPHVRFFAGARAFVHALEAAKVLVCLDKPRKDSAPDKLNSLIYAEYAKHVRPNTYGIAVLAKLASSKRLGWVSRDVGPVVNRKIRTLIPNNTRDRTFVRVAYNSLAHVLVTDDADDFSPRVRERTKKELAVRVVYSAIGFATL